MSNIIFAREESGVQRANKRRFKTSQEAEEYLSANPNFLPSEEDVTLLVEEEFPAVISTPTAKQVVESLTVCPPAAAAENGSKHLAFSVGQWVERMGDDQAWHLEPIRRIVHYETGESFYKTEAGLLVKPEDVRCSEEGVKRVFGMRPHLWQQWAFFRLEKLARFQEHHEHDFLSIKYAHEAERLWEEWLAEERNADFLHLFQSKPRAVQDKLVFHMMSPFAKMDEVMYEWDLNEAEASLFHYNSFLGSGWLTSLTVFAIQMSVPFLVLVYTARVSARFPRFTMEPNSSSVDFELIFSTDWDTFCNTYTPLDQGVMGYLILFIYLIRVFPVVYNTFYETVGDAPTVVSRLNSVRIRAFNQGDDTMFARCGYKLFAYMKSAYIAALNLLLLFVLFLTSNTIDLILNAICLEFVSGFDQEVAERDWYDAGKRYFRAGVLEVMFMNAIDLESFETVEEFCRAFNVSEADYRARISGPIRDYEQAKKDAINPRYMDLKERMWRSMGYVAKEKRIREGVWQYTEQPTAFGVVDHMLLRLLPRAGLVRGIFNRFGEYGTWSKFDQALFLPPVPGSSNDKDAEASFAPDTTILNFHPDSMVHPMLRFARWVKSALLFSTILSTAQVSFRRGQYFRTAFSILDGLFEWFTFIFVLFFFPAGLVTYMYLITSCQPLLTSTEQNPIYSDEWAFGG